MNENTLKQDFSDFYLEDKAHVEGEPSVRVDLVKGGSPDQETQENQERARWATRANRQQIIDTKFKDFIMG